MKALNIFDDIWSYFFDSTAGADGVGGYYGNLGFENNPLFSLRLAILFTFIGAAIACVAMVYNKQSLGKIVRKLAYDGCTSPEKAKTLEELGFAKSYTVKNAVCRNVTLRRFVKCVEEEEFYAAQAAAAEGSSADKKAAYYIDTKTDRFYLPEELRIRAEIRYERKGSGKISAFLAIALLAVALVLVLLFLPQLLGAANDIVGFFVKE